MFLLFVFVFGCFMFFSLFFCASSALSVLDNVGTWPLGRKRAAIAKVSFYCAIKMFAAENKTKRFKAHTHTQVHNTHKADCGTLFNGYLNRAANTQR